MSDGEDDAIWKKQKIDDNNMHEVDIDMMSKPSYTHVMGEGVDEEMKDRYWEVMRVIANEALHDILLHNIFSSLQGKILW